MAVKERHLGGALYFDGRKIADQCVIEEERAEISNGVKVTFCDVIVNRNVVLSLLYGRPVTNNWLKMHGGIMWRKIGGKRRRRKSDRGKK